LLYQRRLFFQSRAAVGEVVFATQHAYAFSSVWSVRRIFFIALFVYGRCHTHTFTDRQQKSASLGHRHRPHGAY
jgi:hypothetical protein